jgi:multidrug efflux pump subunit AcrA (membrane-fusion protein)
MWLGLAVALVVAFLWLLIMQVRSIRSARRYRALTQGADGANLERAVHQHIARVDQLLEQLQALAQQQAQLESRLTAEVQRLDDQAQRTTQHLSERLDHSLHRVGVVRFNPFADTGGDQSFVVALLDGHDDGVVFSGLHSRTGSRVYAKPVTRGSSMYNLSKEEQEAIRQSREA